MGGSASFPVVQIPKSRIFLITGANAGIGYEMAKWSAMMGATVILACRSEDRARKAMERMQEEFKTEKEKGTTGLTDSPTLALEFMKLDLASFQSVVEFCEEFKKSGRQLHVLCCNAGLAISHGKRSADGLEIMLQVNYLSHCIILAKFLPIMKKSGPDCRIVLTSSKAHENGTFDVATMNYTGTVERFPEFDYYGRSKLYQVMQTIALSRSLKNSNITINSFHPGLVDTEIFRPADTCFMKCCLCFCKTIGGMRTCLEGATTGIDLATNPKHAGVSGRYWVDCKITTPSSTSRDEQKQATLWKETYPFIQKYLTEEDISNLEEKSQE
ncbi:retinol dehydrogenase 14-like [Mercenaria mercenaria]|uniref:retinol dehydrogenase 14-like n=1 Tax=Mercenaria mercenaria TaxID=6596 RepID=UPI00234F5BBF|nr:retinol dehydrogenase 14-like [Mercenaria mercenaria]XP_053382241.1 retinol dehydrogenase 14-like [Mercenaria mercenaria]XP_053382242.1 retinol dehydrogenase 14-like [Mercenaria mercenaria]XP_053382243.1 retinol dehydrogenase 14-like [Mercenaria mercenaria]XP_053382244.1 retinol dehydrogenase 14-like [Mercenaria mercenaria]